MELVVTDIEEGQPIPERFAFGIPDPAQHYTLGPNRNPELHWRDAPEGTRSFVILMADPDAPTVMDDVNQEHRVVRADLPRTEFYHWVMVDIPPDVDRIAEGEDSDGVVIGGKPPGLVAKGKRGLNGYTDFLAQNEEMEGFYAGYDGPCPPWNDQRLHHYRFCVYAVDVPKLALEGDFTGAQVRAAMQGHVLAEASVTGTYTLNSALRQ